MMLGSLLATIFAVALHIHIIITNATEGRGQRRDLSKFSIEQPSYHFSTAPLSLAIFVTSNFS